MPLNDPNDPGHGTYLTSEGMVSTATPEAYTGPLGRGPAQYRGRSIAAGSDPISRFNREQAAKRRAEEKYEALAKRAEEEGKALDPYEQYTSTGQFVVYKRGLPQTEENIDWVLTQTYYKDYEKKIKQYQSTVGEASQIASDHNFQSIDPKVQHSELASQRYSLGMGRTPKDEFDYSVARQTVYKDKLYDFTKKVENAPQFIGGGTTGSRRLIGGTTRFLGGWFLESSGAATRMAIGPETAYGAKRQIKERSWETAGLGFDIVTFGGGAVYRKGATKALQKYGVGFFGKTSKLGKVGTYFEGRVFTPLKIKMIKISEKIPISSGGLGLRKTGTKFSAGKGTEVTGIALDVGKSTSISVSKTPKSRTFGWAKQTKDDVVFGMGRSEKLKLSSLKSGGTMVSKDASKYKSPSFFAFAGQTKEVGKVVISRGKVFLERKRLFRKPEKLEIPYLSMTKKSKEFSKDAGEAMFGSRGKGSQKNILKDIYQKEATLAATKTAEKIIPRLDKIEATSKGIKSISPTKQKIIPSDTKYQEYGVMGSGGLSPKSKIGMRQQLSIDISSKIASGTDIKLTDKIKTTTRSKPMIDIGIKTIHTPKWDVGIKFSPKLTQRQKIASKAKYKLKTPKITGTVQPPIPIKPLIPKGDLGLGLKTKISKYKPGKRKHKRKPRYAPSLTGLAFGIKQPKRTKKKTFTGLEVRGI